MEDETSCSRSDTLSDTEDIDLTSLRPYDFEPETSAESNTDSGSDNVEYEVHSEERNLERIGNINWCECNCCRSMNTYQESICCREDVPGDFFGAHKCITEHDVFKAVCLNVAVLKTTLRMLNNLRGDRIEYENISLRYAGYRQFTWWVHNHLGKGVRRVIPSCAIWAIRDKFPDENNSYIPFLEAREEESRL